MAYAPLILGNLDSPVAAAISMATEEHLRQAHYALTVVMPPEKPEHPGTTLGTASAIMILLTIAAASAIRHFDPSKNKKLKGDHDAFVECVEAFFPWEHVSVEDDQYRTGVDLRHAAAEELYTVLRNPLIHSGGVVGERYKVPRIMHIYPGLSPEENENRIIRLCDLVTLSGSTVIKMTAAHSTLYTDALYWCTRKMIERFAIDPLVQSDITRNLGI